MLFIDAAGWNALNVKEFLIVFLLALLIAFGAWAFSTWASDIPFSISVALAFGGLSRFC